ncbi:hypothetical protein P4O66_018184 [Electrophorus voltai]|uniref:Reverse transcriptase domain-containing protein n=1 Tax=Electrophorus voltai TaxID=2609070 RepID=A0AAD8YQ82_9TELE|nr:hypothetical protein P4O66_018184 [Electrophorus voltai]
MEKSSSEESVIHRSPSADSRDTEFAHASASGRPFGGRGFTAGAFYGSAGPRPHTAGRSQDAASGEKSSKLGGPKGSKYVVFYLDLSFVFLLEFKKCNMARGCLCCLKYAMFFFNLIFWTCLIIRSNHLRGGSVHCRELRSSITTTTIISTTTSTITTITTITITSITSTTTSTITITSTSTSITSTTSTTITSIILLLKRDGDLNFTPSPYLILILRSWSCDCADDVNSFSPENKGRDARKRPRGKRAGVRNGLRARAYRAPLPSILLANVQSLDNRLDDLRARIKFQRDIWDCNLLCFTESWLNPAVPSHAIQPAEFFSVHRMDRTADSGKSRGGGVCVMANMDTALWELHEALTDALDDADWDMFRRSTDDVSEAVVGFIGGRYDSKSHHQDDSQPEALGGQNHPRGSELSHYCPQCGNHQEHEQVASSSANANSANGAIGTTNGACAGPTKEQRPLIITESDVRRVFKRVNTRKAMGPDGICGRVLKACADQLAPVFTDILSLMLGIVPSSIKRSTIIPVAKKPRPSGLNDYRPVALTSVVMKCFEKLVRDFITSSLPASMDPLHSAFNTIIPSLITTKLEEVGLHTSLCDWIFLTDRPQSVRVGNCASSTLTLSTGAPQGCVLSPLLYSLYTYDCVATSSSTIIVKFADDTVVMGLISYNDERAYLEEIKHLENWCQGNNLLLNVSKTKELIVDCSKKQEWHYQPVRINGTTVETVDSFRYLGVHISQDLSWSRHTNSLAKKASPSRTGKDSTVVHSAVRITHTELPDLQTIYYKRCQTKARRTVKDPTRPNNSLFSLLRSGRRFLSLKTITKRLISYADHHHDVNNIMTWASLVPVLWSVGFSCVCSVVSGPLLCLFCVGLSCACSVVSGPLLCLFCGQWASLVSVLCGPLLCLFCGQWASLVSVLCGPLLCLFLGQWVSLVPVLCGPLLCLFCGQWGSLVSVLWSVGLSCACSVVSGPLLCLFCGQWASLVPVL